MDQTNELGLPLILILCGILGMLLLALAIIVFFTIYQRRLFAQQEAIRNLEANHQKKLLEYSFEAQEAERKRIASDLHDDVGSILSASRIYIHQLKQDIPNDKYQTLKSDTTDLIDKAIDQIRTVSHNLFPPNLNRLGLIEASNDLCQRIQKIGNIDIHFDYNESISLSKKEELTLYRILQELTNNSLKHAQASKINFEFNSSKEKFKMLYLDNGIGFDHSANISKVKGLGLKSIESRANSIGAKLTIHSELGKGVKVELTLSSKRDEDELSKLV